MVLSPESLKITGKMQNLSSEGSSYSEEKYHKSEKHDKQKLQEQIATKLESNHYFQEIILKYIEVSYPKSTGL